jgi:hypothetical protein
MCMCWCCVPDEMDRICSSIDFEPPTSANLAERPGPGWSNHFLWKDSTCKSFQSGNVCWFGKKCENVTRPHVVFWSSSFERLISAMAFSFLVKNTSTKLGRGKFRCQWVPLMAELSIMCSVGHLQRLKSAHGHVGKSRMNSSQPGNMSDPSYQLSRKTNSFNPVTEWIN